MSDATTCLVVLGAVIVVFVWNRLPVEVVAIGTALALWATGLLTIEQAVAGFGDPIVVFIAALLLVSAGLTSSGATTWASHLLMASIGESRRRLLVLIMLVSAVLSALITLNGSVAALLPVAVTMALRSGLPPSQIAMPLAFAGSAGSLLILTGSPVNIIVSDAADAAGAGQFGFFEFTLVGVPLLAGTVVIILGIGRRVLPNRTPAFAAPDLAKHANMLVREYALEGNLFRLRVGDRSPLVGVRRAHLDVAGYPGIDVVGAQGADGGSRALDDTIQPDDLLVVRGESAQVSAFVVDAHLTVRGSSSVLDGGLPFTPEVGVAEVVIAPRSSLIGDTVFPGMRRRGGLVILAVNRLGQDRGPRETQLAVGDTLLVHGTWESLDRKVAGEDVLVVDSPDLLRQQLPNLTPAGIRAIAVLVAMMALLSLSVVPPVVAGLLAATAMVVLRVVRLEEAYRSMSWTTIILMGGLIPLSTAIQQSGASDQIAEVLVRVVGDGSPYLLLLGIFVLIGALEQIVSNTATALIVTPVAVAAAVEVGVSVQPVLVLVAVAASTSFLTPISTPGNMMVMGPGGYRFGDYWKLGLPIMLWFLVIGLGLVPLIWHF